MRRVTWLEKKCYVVSRVADRPRIEKLVIDMWKRVRPPMQRTEYYMPWGVVTVDELHRMG